MFLVVGDLNLEISEMTMSEFWETYNLENLVKDPPCYENPSKLTHIDLILTNLPKSFQHTQAIVLKTYSPGLKRNIVNYRDSTDFVSNFFDINHCKSTR